MGTLVAGHAEAMPTSVNRTNEKTETKTQGLTSGKPKSGRHVDGTHGRVCVVVRTHAKYMQMETVWSSRM